MPEAVKYSTVARRRTLAAGLVFCAILIASGGCTESVIRQYTRLGKWTSPGETPTVISGTPKSDQAAFDASEETLSEADWKILEQIAPRPIWERIHEIRSSYLARRGRTGTQPARTERDRPTKRAIPKDVPVTELPDGKVRIFYVLRHFGGTVASSTYDSGTQRRKIIREPVDLGPLVNLLNAQLSGKGSCTPLPSENAVVITCNADAKEMTLQLLADVDRPPRQVEIAARIFEVDHDFDFQFGAHALLQHLASDADQSLTSHFSTAGFLDSLTHTQLGDFAFQGSALRLMQVFGNSGLTLDATFQALADTRLIREVASPRITVQVGRTGQMLAGQELPIQSARYTSDQILTEKTTYRPVGVQLYITPQTIALDRVKLHILTVVSAIAGFEPGMSMDQAEATRVIVNPTFDSREAETHVTVPDGDTLVIGGLRMVRHITQERKVPGLGDIKYLEWLFKNHRSQRHLKDLYFFVTPHIIRD